MFSIPLSREVELGTNGVALGVKIFEVEDSILCKFVFAFKFIILL
jgi:hypothetical protein